MARITRTCRLLVAAGLVAVPASAEARLAITRSGASTFVAARAAADAGDARRAAILYASLAAVEPGNGIVARRALAQAILAGDMKLALQLARSRPQDSLPPDARLLMLAEELKGGRAREERLQPLPSELAFVEPFVRSWLLAERGHEDQGVRLLEALPRDNILHVVKAEHQALMWLRAGRIEQARPYISEALGSAGRRSNGVRLAFAAALARSKDRAGALALLQGRDPVLSRAAEALASGGLHEQPVRTASTALSELLLGLALSLNEGDSRALPLALMQVARHADPLNARVRVVLGLMLGQAGRENDALAMLRGLDERSSLLPEAREVELELLSKGGRHEEALARAQAFVAAGAGADDWTRLGDVLDAMDRHAQAAEAYRQAITLADAGAAGPERWTLHLLHGAALEQADRWFEAEKALEAAHALAPDNPVVLNYLGYARLERGEQLDEAEALIAEASRRAPNDASITDSLGWAQFKRGKVAEAIATLHRAAAADPAQAEIHEHLGDALYAAGRKYEARHAWNAALVTAEAEVRTRVEAKIAGGLTPATAAP